MKVYIYCVMWSLLVLSNTVHVFIIHLQCYSHRIIVGLQNQSTNTSSVQFTRFSCSAFLCKYIAFLHFFVRMPEKYLVCWIVMRCHLRNLFGCVRQIIFCLTAQFVLTWCVLVWWSGEILRYFELSPRGFACGGGNLLFYHYILSVVQPCRVFQILHL